MNLHPSTNIACDTDGVVFDFQTAFHRAAEYVTQRKISSPTNSYSLMKRFHLTPEEHDSVWAYFNQKNLWKDLEPYDGAIEALQKLEAITGSSLHIVTAIPSEFVESRRINFHKYGIKPTEIHFMEHINRFSKVPFIKNLRPIMFIDDRIEHLQSSREFSSLLVHIDLKDEQNPVPEIQVDHTCSSLKEWADHFIEHHHQWTNLIQPQKNSLKNKL